MEGPISQPAQKRIRGNDGGAIVVHEQQQPSTLRSSSLPSPTMLLTGHKGSVYSLEFSPNGETLCSTSFDKTCLLWNHSSTAEYEEQLPYKNFNVLQGHKNAVLDCIWLDNDKVATASADKTVQLWDANTGQRIRKWQQHSGIVNAITVWTGNATTPIAISASDDGQCFWWDPRQKSAVGSLEACDFPVTAITASRTENFVYSAGIDGMIVAWDARAAGKKIYGMKGHTDLITCLALHPKDTHVLSNSMDQTLRTWDVRPFVAGKQRHCKTFRGHVHNVEKGLLKCSWSPDGNLVTAGSADKMVHIWDEYSTEELYLLPGHKGCVNAVTFHPVEKSVVCSGASDQRIFVGELS